MGLDEQKLIDVISLSHYNADNSHALSTWRGLYEKSQSRNCIHFSYTGYLVIIFYIVRPKLFGPE